MGKRKAPAKKPQPDARPVNQRGLTWQAKSLTGNRAQRGNLPGGAPRWTYEVLWSSNEKTYEPADCLVGWEADMKRVDDACALRALAPRVNVAAQAQKAREAAAAKKAEELKDKRARALHRPLIIVHTPPRTRRCRCMCHTVLDGNCDFT